jgi:hypothetical protein
MLKPMGLSEEGPVVARRHKHFIDWAGTGVMRRLPYRAARFRCPAGALWDHAAFHKAKVVGDWAEAACRPIRAPPES